MQGVPKGALTLLSSLRFIPRLDLYTWYMWAKSILQGEGPGRVVNCVRTGCRRPTKARTPGCAQRCSKLKAAQNTGLEC